MLQDLRYAVRTLSKSPTFTAIAVLTLAFGIGVNTAVFSLVSSLLLRPLPVVEPDRLALLSTTTSASYRPPFSFAVLEQLEQQARTLDGALAFTTCCGTATMVVGHARYDVNRQWVSGDFFETLGVRPFRGRLLVRADNDVNPPEGPVATISYAFWRRIGSPADVGKLRVTLDDVPFTIVGVTARPFFGVEVGRIFDITVPLRLNARVSRMPISDNAPYLDIAVRLKRGVSMQAAVSELRSLQPRIRMLAMPEQGDRQRFLAEPLTLEQIRTGTSALRDRFGQPLLVMLGIVLLVLLVACANIGNLFLARVISRSRELSIRLALGASRWRIGRHLLAEAVVVSTAGALLGLLFAVWASRLLVTALSTIRAPITLDTSLDWRVLLFTALVTVTIALTCAVTPGARTTRVATLGRMALQGRGMSGAFSSGFIVMQLALAVVLVVLASLLVQTFVRLADESTGLDRGGVLVATVGVSRVPFPSRLGVSSEMLRVVRQTPGVAAAGASLNPPFVGPFVGDLIVSAPGTPPPLHAETTSRLNLITPGWLSAYGISLSDGRDFDDGDTLESPKVMIVNEAFVRHFLPNQRGVGTSLAITLRFPPQGEFSMGVFTIVGVIHNAVFRSVRDGSEPAMFVPMAQRGPSTPYSTVFLGAKTVAGDPTLLERSVRAAIATVNEDVTVSFQTLAQEIDDSIVEERLTALLSGALGVLALVLAAVGVYGITAYTVGQRRREIAIRIALGATAWRVTSVALRRAAWLGLIGTASGLTLAYASARAVRSLLYGVDVHDASTFGVAALLLMVVVLLASFIPSSRAAQVDPMVALKVE
jgi:putative ABC transport system permease protein